MAIYVDNVFIPFRQMLMCHLWSDRNEAELLAFAKAIGLSARWLQKPPKASWVHFDVSKGLRAKALAMGAIETDQFGPLEHEARRTGNTKLLERIKYSRGLRRERTKVRVRVLRTVRKNTSSRREAQEGHARKETDKGKDLLPDVQQAQAGKRRLPVRRTRRA